MSEEHEEQQQGEGDEESLRDTIEAAVAAAEAEMSEDEEASDAGAGADAPEDAAGVQPEASGAGEDDAGAPSVPDTLPDDEGPEGLAEKIGAAPVGWRPAAREGWESLPEHVRREVHRREYDIDRALHETAEARKFQEQWDKAITPYKQLMAQEGASDPLEAVSHLLETANILQNGRPEIKSLRMAQLIHHYGVDLGNLDSSLSQVITGDAPKAPEADPTLQAVDQRLQPVLDFMQQLQGQIRQADQQTQEQTNNRVEEFGKTAEFFEDVRLDMAAFMDAANEAGRKMTLQQAYDFACQVNPRVQEAIKVREQRQKTEKVEQKQALAATTVVDQREGMDAPLSNGDLREDIARAFDAVEAGNRYN